MIIKLKGIEEAKQFVSEMNEFPMDINIEDGHIVLDAKSLLAVLNLDFSKDLNVTCISYKTDDVLRLGAALSKYIGDKNES